MKSTLLLFLCFFATILNAQDKKIGFYRCVYIDNRQHQIRLCDSVDSTTAVKTNCYYVEFDKQNRIETIRYKKHNMLEMDNYGFSAVKIEYSDSVEKRLYSFPERYKKQYKDSSLIKVRLVKLILNQNKIPIALMNYDADGLLA